MNSAKQGSISLIGSIPDTSSLETSSPETCGAHKLNQMEHIDIVSDLWFPGRRAKTCEFTFMWYIIISLAKWDRNCASWTFLYSRDWRNKRCVFSLNGGRRPAYFSTNLDVRVRCWCHSRWRTPWPGPHQSGWTRARSFYSPAPPLRSPLKEKVERNETSTSEGGDEWGEDGERGKYRGRRQSTISQQRKKSLEDVSGGHSIIYSGTSTYEYN